MESWSLEENNKLLELIRTRGTKWSVISEYFPNRTHSSIRNRFLRMNPSVSHKRLKKCNKCTKCGEIKRGHICQIQSNLPNNVITNLKQGNLSKIPNTLFKELDPNVELSLSFPKIKENLNSSFKENYETRDDLNEVFNINQNNLFKKEANNLEYDSKLFVSDYLPPLSICVDLINLGVVIDIHNHNIVGINKNATPRVEINSNFEIKKLVIPNEKELFDVFTMTHYPSLVQKKYLSEKTGLKKKQIENWFHNKRKREKK